MALLFLDSFSTYAIGDIGRKWTQIDSTGTTWVIDATGGRGSRPCLKATRSSGSATPGFVSYTVDVSQGGAWTPTDGGVAGFAFRLNPLNAVDPSSPTAAKSLVAVYGGASLSWCATINTDGTLSFYRNYYGSPELIGTSSQAISNATWVYLEFKWYIHSSSGTLECHANGAEVFSWTGNLVYLGGPSTWTSIRALSSKDNFSSLEQRMMDFYLCDLSGSSNDDFLGDVTVGVLRPSGAGNSTGWTPNTGANYAAVDDASADDDTTYIAATALVKDTYAHENVPSGVQDVDIVTIGHDLPELT